MTVQTQAQPGIITGSSAPARGLKGFVVGLVALAAAATGIGIVASATNGPSVVLAPAAAVPQTTAVERMHADAFLNPAGSDQIDALERFHADAAQTREVLRYQYPGKPGIK